MHVVSLRFDRKKGAELWLSLDQPAAIPQALALRLRLPRQSPWPPLSVEQRVMKRLSLRMPGSLHYEKLPLAVPPPGRYHAYLDLFDYSRPSKTVPAHTADLGLIAVH